MPRHRDRERLRTTFGSVAEQYDRARPSYPDGIFDDLAELAGLRAGSRVVEVGPGTGKATVELVRRGYAVSGVELSADLADVARRNAPAAEIVVSDFEHWQPETAGFDAIVATAAYHWIAPELRYAKPLALLKPRGALAVVHGRHVLPEDGDPIWAEMQEDYDAVVPHPDNAPPPPPEDVVERMGRRVPRLGRLRARRRATPSPAARLHRRRVRRRARHILGKPRASGHAARRALSPDPRPHRCPPRRRGDEALPPDGDRRPA